MATETQKYIAKQATDRQAVMQSIHDIIVVADKSVVPVVEPMMGKEMIIYKAKGTMKYALAGVQKYMSLHMMPLYISPALFAKYQALLPSASFQKGCINFDTGAQLPLTIVKNLFKECAAIDLQKILEDYRQARKKATPVRKQTPVKKAVVKKAAPKKVAAKKSAKK